MPNFDIIDGFAIDYMHAVLIGSPQRLIVQPYQKQQQKTIHEGIIIFLYYQK